METTYKPAEQQATQIGMSSYDVEVGLNKHLKAISVLNMIKQSNSKIKNILTNEFYAVFGTEFERKVAIEKQRKVTNRLVNYYTRNYGI